MEIKFKYKLWTDGSCYHKDRIGGWAFVFTVNNKIVFENFYFEENTTTVRMEMMAVWKALKFFNKNNSGKKCQLLTDHLNIVKAINNKWYRDWYEIDFNGVKNKDIWKKILKELFKRKNNFTFEHVKAHNGIYENERADFLAGYCRKYKQKALKDEY